MKAPTPTDIGLSVLYPNRTGPKWTLAEMIEEFFWGRVIKLEGEDSCWIFCGTWDHGGYGQIGGRLAEVLGEGSAHRISWVLENGPIPNGLHVMHHCDTPSCVRPTHLLLGTPLTNAHDKISKGRAVNPPIHSHGGRPKGSKNK